LIKMSVESLLNGYVRAPHPPIPGAVASIRIDGREVEAACVGESIRYAGPDGRLLPEHARRLLRPDDLFDLASVTKMFATVTILRLVDAGVLDLDAPLQAWLPSYRQRVKRQVTLRHLLTHTSGLPANAQLWKVPGGRADRIAALLDTPLEATPGSAFTYSCVGYMTAMALAELRTGHRFDQLVHSHLLGPLGLTDTVYRPLDAGFDADRCVPTEYDTTYRRRLIRGEVHDENAFSLDQISANAGLFATAADVAAFGEAVRTNATADGSPLLDERTYRQMCSDQLPRGLDPGFRHGLGWRIGEVGCAGPLAGSYPLSHTGFTGTSLIVHPGHGLVVTLMTARVHPSRDFSDVAGLRQAVATRAAELVAAAHEPGTPEAPAQEPTHQPIGRVTARVLVRDPQGELLLLHGHDPAHPEQPFWYTPGGGIEAGENPRTAAVRELAEELGLRVDDDDLDGPVHTDTADYTYNGERVVQHQEYYLLDVPRFAPKPAPNGSSEHAAVTGTRWWQPRPGATVDGDPLWPGELYDIMTRLNHNRGHARSHARR
jgi:CubicO group peptidase (beta-lactamase class C family)/8-oxo-dGTP pyrophosphatase MutT (NUDIX family)